MITVRGYKPTDAAEMQEIWNEVVKEGDAFPQKEPLSIKEAEAFFSGQTHCAVACDNEAGGKIAGLYILHPNNVGRCGHIANASYAVSKEYRGQHIGECLVKDCMAEGVKAGYRILQFNAVVATNIHARHLYERLGFQQLGTIKGGFCLDTDNGPKYVDICPYYATLV